MIAVRNAWYVAAWPEDLGFSKPLGLSLLNEPIVLYRRPGGALAASPGLYDRFEPDSGGSLRFDRNNCLQRSKREGEQS